MTDEYKSAERIAVEYLENKIEPFIGGLNVFASSAAETFWVVNSSFFLVPRSIRRTANKQDPSLNTPINDRFIGSELLGRLGGLMSGGFTSLLGIEYILKETFHGNYVPAVILGASELASFGYEFGRLAKSRQEYREARMKLKLETS